VPGRRPGLPVATRSDSGRYVDQPSGDPPFMRRPRRFGCEDYPPSGHLKTRFEARTGETWKIYDKAGLELVSQDEHLSRKVLSDLGNPSSSADAIGVLGPGDRRQRDVFRQPQSPSAVPPPRLSPCRRMVSARSPTAPIHCRQWTRRPLTPLGGWVCASPHVCVSTLDVRAGLVHQAGTACRRVSNPESWRSRIVNPPRRPPSARSLIPRTPSCVPSPIPSTPGEH
jgi:hypothetical protein